MNKTTLRLRGALRYVFVAAATGFACIGFLAFTRPETGVLTRTMYGTLAVLSVFFIIRILFGLQVIITDDYVQTRGSFRWRKFPLHTVDRLTIDDDTPGVAQWRLQVVLVDGTVYRPADFASRSNNPDIPGTVAWVAKLATSDVYSRKV